ncbi:MAG: phosphoribosyltransferase [Flavobacteriaceae bacterium]|nr:phosphoribosyltransferase [Flavobacteriaceae bacterium]
MSILTHQQIDQKLTRLAWQIYEQNIDADSIVLAGIADMGYVLAELLANNLRDISPLKVELLKVELDKKNPNEDATIVYGKAAENQAVVLVDDVLNSGRTLAYAALPFLKRNCRPIQICVLVNRNHRSFPVSADFVGLSLATTLQEHVEVSYTDGEFEAVLR